MRKPRIDGVRRRIKIVSYLRENPGAKPREIAQGVGLVVRRGCCPILETHLAQLEAEGLVRQTERGLVAV